MKNEKGQMISIVAILFVVVLAISGFVFDAGRVYVDKVRIQTVIKEALKAGSKYLPDYEEGLVGEIELILELNGYDPSTFSIYVRDDKEAIAIVKDSIYETVFWSIVGINELEYQNEEILILDPQTVEGLSGLAPLTLDVDYFHLYQDSIPYSLEVGPVDAPLSIVRYESDTISKTSEQIEDGTDLAIYLQDYLVKKPGESNGYLNNFEQRLEDEPIIFLSVADFYDGADGEILGFLKFKLQSIDTIDGDLTVTGEFIAQSLDYGNMTTDITPFYVYNRKFVKNILPESRWWKDVY